MIESKLKEALKKQIDCFFNVGRPVQLADSAQMSDFLFLASAFSVNIEARIKQ
jgi:hypothetical protein